jgi:hypothetical protein
MSELLAFLDEVDALCEELPDWLPEQAERIERIKEHALRLCRECIRQSKDVNDGNNPKPDD